MLFEVSVGVGGNNELTGVDMHLRIATAEAMPASTCSSLLVVPDAPSQNRDGHTRMNNTKTDGPSVWPF